MTHILRRSLAGSAWMIFAFDSFELDVPRAELRRVGEPVAVEPKVFQLLQLLLENRGELLSKDRLIEEVWQGRHVSDTAVTSCIKAARQAIDDDGKRQRFIKTVHGRGIRFVAEVTSSESTAPQDRLAPASAPAAPVIEEPAERPAIAILPFQQLGEAGPYDAIAKAIPHEIISELSRLRWLFVIARGTAFQFNSESADVRAIGQTLQVNYCVTGSVEIIGPQMRMTVEIADTRTAGVVWSERFASTVDDIHRVRSEIIASILNAVELRISANEAQRVKLQAPESLDAWSAYHLGVDQMLRFTKDSNAQAQSLFETALKLEPDFCRAAAGLSFTHFQNAFLRHAGKPEEESRLARSFAEQSLELDALDPFANLTMGRSYWLTGDLDSSRAWLQRSVDLCPNYATGLYSQAWASVLSGDGTSGETHAEEAIALSPMDPFLYAMVGTRALSRLIRGEYDTAAILGEQAARLPRAHVMIDIIAALCHGFNGDVDAARPWIEQLKRRNAEITQADFFRSFPFVDPQLRERMSALMTTLGLRA